MASLPPAGVHSAGDRQSSIRCPAFNSCRQLLYARPTGDLVLVERVRLRCPMITELSLCPATSQRARQHRMADRAAFRRCLAGRRPFTDSRPVNTTSISGRAGDSAMQESPTQCKADCNVQHGMDRAANAARARRIDELDERGPASHAQYPPWFRCRGRRARCRAYVA